MKKTNNLIMQESDMEVPVGKDLWKLDKRLSSLEYLLDSIQLISLDIFDTLLFRTCEQPKDIFYITGKKALKNGLLPAWCDEHDYQKARISALDRAYSENQSEPNLEIIFDYLPSIFKEKRKLMQLELAVEKEYSFLNPSMVSFLLECNMRKIPVILLSDMYLNKKQLLDLLWHIGLNPALITDLIVSSEEGCMKSTGELFKRLTDKYPGIPQKDILHIGDNLFREIIQAKRLGFQTCHYDIIPGDDTGIFEYEKLMYKNVIPELFSMRKLALMLTSSLQGKERAIGQIGAAVFGPFLSALCEWVVNMALEENCDAIAPFMREAVLLAPMIQKVVEKRGLDIPVIPLYVSRQAVVHAGENNFDVSTLDKMARTRQYFKIKELFKTLGFDETPDQFRAFADNYLQDAKRIQFSGKTKLYNALEEYLLRKENLAIINGKINEKKESLDQYCKETLKTHQKIITLDLGFFGQIQAGIERAINGNKQYHFIHLLAFGREKLMDLLNAGMDFRLFAGGMSCHAGMISEIHRSAPIIEQLLMSEEGSTLGYQKNLNGKIVPVLENNPITKAEIETKKIAQKAIFNFQELWFYLGEHSSITRTLIDKNRDDWGKIIHRLLKMPTVMEAETLGGLHNDTNFGSSRTVKMCPDEEVGWVNTIGKQEYLKVMKKSEAVWPDGILTHIFPESHVYLRAKEKYGEKLDCVIRLITEIKKKNISEVLCYGIGEDSYQFIRVARYFGIKVKSILHDKIEFDGAFYDGIPIRYSKDAGHEYRYIVLPDSQMAKENYDSVFNRSDMVENKQFEFIMSMPN